jgi:hypothetical protein
MGFICELEQTQGIVDQIGLIMVLLLVLHNDNDCSSQENIGFVFFLFFVFGAKPQYNNKVTLFNSRTPEGYIYL